MTFFDIAVLVIIGLSILLAVMRGVVKEVLSLVGWGLAIWLAMTYTVPVAQMLPAGIPNEAIRLLAAFVILFLGALLLAALAAITAAELIRTVGLGATDRLLGAVFGLARGVLIVAILVLLAGLTTFPRQPFWRNAMFSAPFEELVIGVKPWLPDGLSKRINYE
jgi:membrane protein required for colicin V production